MKINGNYVPSGRLIGLVFGLGMENKKKNRRSGLLSDKHVQ